MVVKTWYSQGKQDRVRRTINLIGKWIGIALLLAVAVYTVYIIVYLLLLSR